MESNADRFGGWNLMLTLHSTVRQYGVGTFFGQMINNLPAMVRTVDLGTVD